MDHQSEYMALVMVYVEIWKENDPVTTSTKKEVAINMHNLAVSDVPGGPYCDSNVNARIET